MKWLLAAAVAALAAAPACKPERVKLPMDWKVGSEHRYQAVWTRAIEAWKGPGSPPPSMNTEQRGQVVVRVTARSKDGYLVRWEPTVTTSYPPRARGDLEAAALEGWRFGFTLEMDLRVDPRSAAAPTLRNAREVHAKQTASMLAVLRELPAFEHVDCQGGDASSAMCQVIPDESSTTANAVLRAMPLFLCAGLDVGVRGPDSWSEPHPSPEVGEAVHFHKRREVVGYDAKSPHIRVKMSSQPDGAEFQAWMKAKAAAMQEGKDTTELLQKIAAQMSVRFETDCTMDLRTGWPVSVEFKSSGDVAGIQGSETYRFERME